MVSSKASEFKGELLLEVILFNFFLKCLGSGSEPHEAPFPAKESRLLKLNLLDDSHSTGKYPPNRITPKFRSSDWGTCTQWDTSTTTSSLTTSSWGTKTRTPSTSSTSDWVLNSRPWQLMGLVFMLNKSKRWFSAETSCLLLAIRAAGSQSPGETTLNLPSIY